MQAMGRTSSTGSPSWLQSFTAYLPTFTQVKAVALVALVGFARGIEGAAKSPKELSVTHVGSEGGSVIASANSISQSLLMLQSNDLLSQIDRHMFISQLPMDIIKKLDQSETFDLAIQFVVEEKKKSDKQILSRIAKKLHARGITVEELSEIKQLGLYKIKNYQDLPNREKHWFMMTKIMTSFCRLERKDSFDGILVIIEEYIRLGKIQVKMRGSKEENIEDVITYFTQINESKNIRLITSTLLDFMDDVNVYYLRQDPVMPQIIVNDEKIENLKNDLFGIFKELEELEKIPANKISLNLYARAFIALADQAILIAEDYKKYFNMHGQKKITMQIDRYIEDVQFILREVFQTTVDQCYSESEQLYIPTSVINARKYYLTWERFVGFDNLFKEIKAKINRENRPSPTELEKIPVDYFSYGFGSMAIFTLGFLAYLGCKCRSGKNTKKQKEPVQETAPRRPRRRHVAVETPSTVPEHSTPPVSASTAPIALREYKEVSTMTREEIVQYIENEMKRLIENSATKKREKLLNLITGRLLKHHPKHVERLTNDLNSYVNDYLLSQGYNK